MKPRQERIKPQKSLRSILTLWFLLFSVAPLAFVTGYSLVQFQGAIDEELNKRLRGNAREITVVLNDLENYLVRFGKSHASDTSLVYYLSTQSIPNARRLVSGWMAAAYPANRISLFDRNGKLVVALYKPNDGEVKNLSNLETGNVYLADSITKKLENQIQIGLRDIGPKYGLELIVYTKVLDKRNRISGYIEEDINVDETFLKNFQKRLNLEITLFDKELKPVVSTHPDFLLYTKTFFGDQLSENRDAFFEITSRGLPFGFLISRVQTGESQVILGLAASKQEIKDVLRGINRALFSVVGLIVILLIITLFSASNLFLKPIYDLVDAARRIESGEVGTQVPIESDTEIGLLTQSFNQMSKKVAEARSALEAKILELQNTQAQLVHSAKMVSLGQLVAGVAHELNNPIAFIYSNMSHLKDYGEKLGHLVTVANEKPQTLKAEMERVEFSYIVEDMPRLIKSCEDGARRVRDIVIGLRNFSRLDELQIKEVNIEEALKNTLALISGETKNRIQVHLEFGKIPEIRCYASQINQVFMNLLSNAAQAIPDKGEIWVNTRVAGDQICIRIRDSGKGIPADQLDKIFDPFFTTKSVGQGTGLGLSITYGIVQKHNGKIQVESFVGKGTTFSVYLPIAGPSFES